MSIRTVLISGAGIAGPTLAYWLIRNGFHVTLVERAQGLRSSGSPVDVRGPAVPVAEQMGVMPELRAVATRVTALTFLGGSGRRVGRIDLGAIARAGGSREVELPRGDLARVLAGTVRDDAEFLFDDTITAIDQDPGGVNVTFDRAAPRRFDLVIGADGLHSAVRRLAFGPEAGFARHMGVYVGGMALDGPIDGLPRSAHDVFMYNLPGRAVAIHPSNGRSVAAFMYRSPAVPGFDYRDMDQHRALLTEAYAGASWLVPQLLDQVRTTDDLYFDSVSQVRLPNWSSGRVTLLGDAAACVSLFGEGSSLAIAGAATLAEAIAATPDDPAAAFAGYEARHRPLVTSKQSNAGLAAALLIPATKAGIMTRNAATRLWPLVAAAQWASRRVGRPASPAADRRSGGLEEPAGSPRPPATP
jgi:2-polyprenyl-6-methoxyphenol hydroxylase-like FAD-dependent oxidoreductase